MKKVINKVSNVDYIGESGYEKLNWTQASVSPELPVKVKGLIEAVLSVVDEISTPIGKIYMLRSFVKMFNYHRQKYNDAIAMAKEATNASQAKQAANLIERLGESKVFGMAVLEFKNAYEELFADDEVIGYNNSEFVNRPVEDWESLLKDRSVGTSKEQLRLNQILDENTEI